MVVHHESCDLGSVRIPAELNATLSQFFAELQSRIIEKAVRRAAARAIPEQAIVVQREELVQSAQEAFAETAGQLNETFSVSELKHVRRAS